MENSIYNSLADKLKQTGLIPKEENDNDLELTLFGITPDEDINNSPFINKTPNKTVNEAENKAETAKETNSNKKRINEYDLELIKGQLKNEENAISFLKVLKRFLNFKELMITKGTISNREKIFHRLFPKLYKIKIAKEAIKRLTELGIDTNALLSKTIPYGEKESRYSDLVKYLNYANQIRVKLNEKF